jgi:hypothetical protein
MEVRMHGESTNEDQGAQYEALVKSGDAVATPDDAVWVVNEVAGEVLEVVAAERADDGLVYVDPYEQTVTSVPTALARKVADARSVRRP